jgi:hypothetical protein
MRKFSSLINNYETNGMGYEKNGTNIGKGFEIIASFETGILFFPKIFSSHYYSISDFPPQDTDAFKFLVIISTLINYM